MDRPGFPRQSPGSEEAPAGSSNPFARVAALTGHGAPAPTVTPGTISRSSAPNPEAPPVAEAPPVTEASATSAGDTAPVGGTAVPPKLGRLARVTADRLWPTDAAFAAWLADNLDSLGEASSLKLQKPQVMRSEVPVILAALETGRPAVIVCQRDGSTDEAFGALVRHVAASTAEHAIWICGDPGDEHGAAVSWLNRSIDGRFVMIKVGAVTIGESAAAPTFELLVREPRADDDVVESAVPAVSSTPSGSARRAGDWLADAAADGQGS